MSGVAAGDMGRALRGDTCGPSGAQSNPKQSIVVLRKGREGSQNRREGKGREGNGKEGLLWPPLNLSFSIQHMTLCKHDQLLVSSISHLPMSPTSFVSS